mmetsp:Transcript_115643/g.307505  ORF Transcript_115643/g.307505 Transcript_115643/m.307505 type:complete len:239 (+) Transcript_115643:2865-3581(+)
MAQCVAGLHSRRELHTMVLAEWGQHPLDLRELALIKLLAGGGSAQLAERALGLRGAEDLEDLPQDVDKALLLVEGLEIAGGHALHGARVEAHAVRALLETQRHAYVSALHLDAVTLVDLERPDLAHVEEVRDSLVLVPNLLIIIFHGPALILNILQIHVLHLEEWVEVRAEFLCPLRLKLRVELALLTKLHYDRLNLSLHQHLQELLVEVAHPVPVATVHVIKVEVHGCGVGKQVKVH